MPPGRTAPPDRRGRLAYQPVVSLADGRLHHHEVLVRFGSEGSPFPTIRMAEEMDLIGPVKRTAGKYRLYNERSLKRIKAIQALQSPFEL